MTHDITREASTIDNTTDMMCMGFFVLFLFVQFIPYIKVCLRLWLWESGVITYLFTGGGGSSVDDTTAGSVALETDIGLD